MRKVKEKMEKAYAEADQDFNTLRAGDAVLRF